MHMSLVARQLPGADGVRQEVTVEMGLVMAERGQRLPQRWQTTAAGRARWCKLLGAAGRMEPWLRPLLVLVLLRGCGGALAAGCAKGVVSEQGTKSYHLSTLMGLLRLPVALAGRKGFESDPIEYK